MPYKDEYLSFSWIFIDMVFQSLLNESCFAYVNHLFYYNMMVCKYIVLFALALLFSFILFVIVKVKN